MNSILIIDSNKKTAGLIKELLRKEGYKVYYSDKGKNGLHKARDKKPDLILMDLILPDTEGFDLIKELKSSLELRKIPLIVYSEKNEDFDKVLALELGADDYVTKPACFREIAARIKSQFRYYKSQSGYCR